MRIHPPFSCRCHGAHPRRCRGPRSERLRHLRGRQRVGRDLEMGHRPADPLGPGGQRRRRPVPDPVAGVRVADQHRRPGQSNPRPRAELDLQRDRQPGHLPPTARADVLRRHPGRRAKRSRPRSSGPGAAELRPGPGPRPITGVTTNADNDVIITLTQPDYQIPLLFGERVLQVASPKAAADPTSSTRTRSGRARSSSPS